MATASMCRLPLMTIAAVTLVRTPVRWTNWPSLPPALRVRFVPATGKTGAIYPYFYCLGRSKKRFDCQLPYLAGAMIRTCGWPSAR